MSAAAAANGHQEAIELSDLRLVAQPAGLRAGRAEATGVEAYDAAFLASLRPAPPAAPRRRRDRLQGMWARTSSTSSLSLTQVYELMSLKGGNTNFILLVIAYIERHQWAVYTALILSLCAVGACK
jgi:hypothetical protein